MSKDKPGTKITGNLVATNISYVKPPVLNYETPDVNGYVPDKSLIHTVWKHSGNEKLYEITAFSWLGATDEWGYACVECKNHLAVTVVRPITHLEGNRENGEKRYTKISGETP